MYETIYNIEYGDSFSVKLFPYTSWWCYRCLYHHFDQPIKKIFSKDPSLCSIKLNTLYRLCKRSSNRRYSSAPMKRHQYTRLFECPACSNTNCSYFRCPAFGTVPCVEQTPAPVIPPLNFPPNPASILQCNGLYCPVGYPRQPIVPKGFVNPLGFAPYTTVRTMKMNPDLSEKTLLSKSTRGNDNKRKVDLTYASAFQKSTMAREMNEAVQGINKTDSQKEHTKYKDIEQLEGKQGTNERILSEKSDVLVRSENDAKEVGEVEESDPPFNSKRKFSAVEHKAYTQCGRKRQKRPYISQLPSITEIRGGADFVFFPSAYHLLNYPQIKHRPNWDLPMIRNSDGTLKSSAMLPHQSLATYPLEYNPFDTTAVNSNKIPDTHSYITHPKCWLLPQFVAAACPFAIPMGSPIPVPYSDANRLPPFAFPPMKTLLKLQETKAPVRIHSWKYISPEYKKEYIKISNGKNYDVTIVHPSTFCHALYKRIDPYRLWSTKTM